MNVSIPIDQLIESQIDMVFHNIRESFLQEDDEVGEVFRIPYPESFKVLAFGIGGIQLKEKRTVLERLINNLDDCDNYDIFGTEGWRHRFGMD